MSSFELYAIPENVEKREKLQALVKTRFVKPIGEEHMYYAAMHIKKCKLILLGKYYWIFAKKGVI